MTASLPSLESLRCFAAAAKLLSFRKAAQSVALTPAALGARIAQLEDQLGVSLFLRTTRSVRLTDAGLGLLPVAERCLAEAAACAPAARGETGPPPMELTLGTRQELGLSWVVPQLDALARRFPTVQLHLYFGSGDDLLLRVRTMEIDLAITSTRFSDPKLSSIQVHREDYVLVGAPGLLKKTPLRKPADARAHTLLDATADMPLFRYWRDAPGGGDVLSFARLVRLGSIEAIRQRLLEGAGMGVVPRYLVRRDLAAGKLRVVFPRVTPQSDWFRLVFRGDDPRRAVYGSLAEAMRERPLR